MSRLQKQIKIKESLKEKFWYLNEDVIDLLTNMLKFNPNDRASISECLQNKIFDNIRDLELEKPSTIKI